jgi:AAA+ superfamily predicted ATPase
MKQKNLPNMEKTQKKMSKSFAQYLQHVSIDHQDLYNIEYLLNYFNGPLDPKISSKSFILYGRPGVGKTFFAEQIINEMNKETLYIAPRSLDSSRSYRCDSIDELFTKISKTKSQIIFLDDISYLFSTTEFGEFETEDKQALMKLLELVKQQSNKILLVTMNGFNGLGHQIIDRMEVIIHIDVPEKKQKQQFLQSEFNTYISKELQSFIANNSIGYNYRDLPEMLKLAFRMGNHQITKESVKKALSVYQPTQLYGFHVENAVNETLDDVIGKKKPLQMVKRVVKQYQHQQLSEQLQLKRNNILLFHGPPGSGKSFMTRALAGEIKFPLIHVSTNHFHGGNPFRGIHQIMDMAKRYRRCVIFVDEAEKMIGNGRYGEDNAVLGELHRLLDGGDGGEVHSILVFAINDISRFGQTLLDRFNLVEFSLPSFEERKAFFSAKINQVKKHVQISVSPRDLAFRSEEMSFREMDRFWNDLMIAHLEGGKGIKEEAYQLRNYPWSSDVMYG